MRYSIEPRDRTYVKGYGFLSLAKNMGKCLSNKYGQQLLDSAKKSTTDAIKTASKRTIQKTAEATGDLTGNKISNKITIVSKKKRAKELHDNNDEDVEITTHKRKYIFLEEREQIIEELKISTKIGCTFLNITNKLVLTLKIYISPKKRQQIIDELRLV